MIALIIMSYGKWRSFLLIQLASPEPSENSADTEYEYILQINKENMVF